MNIDSFRKAKTSLLTSSPTPTKPTGEEQMTDNTNIPKIELSPLMFKQKDSKLVVESRPKQRKRANPDEIPLHKGCNIFINKSQLLEIYTPHPALYTIRLAEIVFGRETLSTASKDSLDNALDLLDQNVLGSVIGKI